MLSTRKHKIRKAENLESQMRQNVKCVKFFSLNKIEKKYERFLYSVKNILFLSTEFIDILSHSAFRLFSFLTFGIVTPNQNLHAWAEALQNKITKNF